MMMRNRRRWFGLITLCILGLYGSLSACSPVPAERQAPTAPSGDISDATAAQSVAAEYLSAWQSEDYARMYSLLSTLSQDALPLEDFEDEHQDFDEAMTLQDLDFKMLSTMSTELSLIHI